jgi:hypothetical protein
VASLLRWAPAWLTAAILTSGAAGCVMTRPVEAGFWFEKVEFRSVVLGGALTADDLGAIERVARAELVGAYAGLPIRITDRRDATFRVRVIQAVLDRRMRGTWNVAGEAFAVPGLGGHASVSFEFLANGAVAASPRSATRDEVLQAIGRGIGRTAAHELAHALLPQAPIHDSQDVRSYEYDSAARREQYFGEMHWALARPLLEARLSQ